MAMILNPSRLRMTQAKFFGKYYASGSGVVSLSEGQGIVLTPDPIIGTGTIALDAPVAPGLGGTGANLAATGGAGQYVKQVGVGSAFTVGTIPYTDVGVGYVKVNGTTPMTADWNAGNFRITSDAFAANVAAPVAKVQFQYLDTDAMVNDPSAGGEDVTQPRLVGIVDGSAAVPVASPLFSEVHQRIDAAVGAPNTVPYLYSTRKMAGSGNVYNFQSLVKNIGGDLAGDSDIVAVLGSASSYPSVAPTGNWTTYSFWGQSTRTKTHSRAVGMELDIWNSSGVDSYWSAKITDDPPDGNLDSTIGIAVNCSGANKNSVGIVFQGTAVNAWRTGIFLGGNNAIEKYGVDAADLPITASPLRIADGATIIARNAADSGDYSLIRAKGTTNVSVGSLALTGAVADLAANTAVGNQALLVDAAGINNTAVGANTLAANTSGSSNTAVGRDALLASISGHQNTAVGMQSLSHITTVSDNTAVGFNTLHANTATGNTAVGSQALSLNTSGAANTAVGTDSLAHNTTTSFNTAIGSNSLHATTGAQNTAVGASAMLANTSGTDNVAVGFNALAAVATSSYSTALGTTALYKSTGSTNTAIGFASLYENLGGNGNVAVGVYALKTNTTGGTNVAVGNNALYTNSTGSKNIALGESAGKYETGSNAFYVDNQDRTNTAGDKAKAILYGVMDATAANQTLRINAKPSIGVTLSNYANNAAALLGGLAAGDLYTITGSNPLQLAIVY